MGLVQGESMSQRFFHRLGASLVDRDLRIGRLCRPPITLGSRIGIDMESLIRPSSSSSGAAT